MIDFRANELCDDIYCRYLQSFNYTLDSIDSTGLKLYDYYSNQLLSNFKKDIKTAFNEVKMYKKYCLKVRKLEIKFENLDFSVKSVEEYKELGCFSRLRYRYKRWRFNGLNNKGYKLNQKYYLYLPHNQRETSEDEKTEQ